MLTDKEFFRLACEWMYERGVKVLECDGFLQDLRNRGVSDTEIMRCRKSLESRRIITNDPVSGDLAVNLQLFYHFVKTDLARDSFEQARSIWKVHQKSQERQFDSESIARQTGVSGIAASCILEALLAGE